MIKIRRSSRFWLAVVLITVFSFSITPSLPALPGIAATKAPVNPHFEQYMGAGLTGQLPITAQGHHLGYVPSPVQLPTAAPTILRSTYSLSALPAAYDLRDSGKVTAVRNQSTSGSCWAFATYGSMESSLLIDNETWDFSENNLKNTHGFDIGANSGGNGYMSTAYLGRWSGPVNELGEGGDPFVASSTSSPSNLPVQKHVQEAEFIPADLTAIKQAVYDNGAVYTAFYYADSYFNDTYDAYYCGISRSANHAVTIVGWDDNYPASNFKTSPAGNGAFIIKNSWGTSWGEAGYFYLSYYDQSALAENVAFHNAEDPSSYDNNYDYDPLGWVGSYSYSWGANVFTASASETLDAVAFYTPVANSTYQVKVYTGVTSTPTSGTLAGSQTGTIAMAGYHTVTLNSPISLLPGQKFSVVLNLTTPGYNYPMAVEYSYAGYSSAAAASPGQSYLGFNGTSWTDATSVKSSMNVCIKAFTDYAGPAGPDLLMSALDAPASAAPGQTVSIANTVQYQGSGPAASFKVRFFLSSDQTIDAGDIVLGSKTVSSLAAGSSNQVPTSVTIPSDAALGSYYILAWADADQVVAEINEDNNVRSDAISLAVTPKPDLIIKTVDGPAAGTIGRTISIANTVENIGDAPAGSFVVKFYLSSDLTLDSKDIYLGYRTVRSLGVRAISSATSKVTIPKTTPATDYYVFAVADANLSVAELAENNNIGFDNVSTKVSK